MGKESAVRRLGLHSIIKKDVGFPDGSWTIIDRNHFIPFPIHMRKNWFYMDKTLNQKLLVDQKMGLEAVRAAIISSYGSISKEAPSPTSKDLMFAMD